MTHALYLSKEQGEQGQPETGGKGTAAAAELLTVSMFILWLVYFAYA